MAGDNATISELPNPIKPGRNTAGSDTGERTSPSRHTLRYRILRHHHKPEHVSHRRQNALRTGTLVLPQRDIRFATRLRFSPLHQTRTRHSLLNQSLIRRLPIRIRLERRNPTIRVLADRTVRVARRTSEDPIARCHRVGSLLKIADNDVFVFGPRPVLLLSLIVGVVGGDEDALTVVGADLHADGAELVDHILRQWRVNSDVFVVVRVNLCAHFPQQPEHVVTARCGYVDRLTLRHVLQRLRDDRQLPRRVVSGVDLDRLAVWRLLPLDVQLIEHRKRLLANL